MKRFIGRVVFTAAYVWVVAMNLRRIRKATIAYGREMRNVRDW